MQRTYDSSQNEERSGFVGSHYECTTPTHQVRDGPEPDLADLESVEEPATRDPTIQTRQADNESDKLNHRANRAQWNERRTWGCNQGPDSRKPQRSGALQRSHLNQNLCPLHGNQTMTTTTAVPSVASRDPCKHIDSSAVLVGSRSLGPLALKTCLSTSLDCYPPTQVERPLARFTTDLVSSSAAPMTETVTSDATSS